MVLRYYADMSEAEIAGFPGDGQEQGFPAVAKLRIDSGSGEG